MKKRNIAVKSVQSSKERHSDIFLQNEKKNKIGAKQMFFESEKCQVK